MGFDPLFWPSGGRRGRFEIRPPEKVAEFPQINDHSGGRGRRPPENAMLGGIEVMDRRCTVTAKALSMIYPIG